jgi:hypothetical protein
MRAALLTGDGPVEMVAVAGFRMLTGTQVLSIPRAEAPFTEIAARGATMRRSFAAASTVFSVAFMLLVSPVALAAPLHNLVDGNSVASWDLGAQSGMYSWTVDGSEQAVQQWFWYRVGDDPMPITTSNNVEQSLDTLPLTVSGVTDTNFDTLPDTLFARYDDNQFDRFYITTTFLLTGGASGSGTSDIAESITIQNLTSEPLPFHFFQYTDLNLAGTPNNDSISIITNNVVQQTDALGNGASETVVTPAADYHEAGSPMSILAKLNDAVRSTLDDTSNAGPGDVAWAYQWDFLIPANGSVLISKDKHIQLIPEPSSLVLAAIAAAALAVPIARRRRRR